MLKGLRRVRWHELRHAYGSAEEVPGLLSRIAWGDARAASTALSDLALRIGELAVFGATVPAVPFLWELAVTERVRPRAEVMALLETILEHGNPPQADVQRQAHQAVLHGRGTAERLTEDRDPAVRAAARSLLAAIDTHTCPTCRPTP
ncbi:hypothetical protein GCM10027168_45670 [Streptomyces capparidis]